MFHHVLVPLDGTLSAEQALPYAKEMARPGQTQIRLLRLASAPAMVGHPLDMPGSAAVIAHELENCQDYLQDVGHQLQEQGYQVTWCDRFGEPASGILREVEDSGVDLVVMATHGRTGFRRFLLGSVAEKVARHAPCPVLLVRREEPDVP